MIEQIGNSKLKFRHATKHIFVLGFMVGDGTPGSVFGSVKKSSEFLDYKTMLYRSAGQISLNMQGAVQAIELKAIEPLGQIIKRYPKTGNAELTF